MSLFLFEKKNLTLLDKITLAESNYHQLAKLVRMHTEAASARTEKFTEAGFTEDDTVDYEKAKKAAGMSLIGKLDSMTSFIELRLAKDESKYLAAGKELRKALTELFGENEVVPFTAMGARKGLSALDKSQVD